MTKLTRPLRSLLILSAAFGSLSARVHAGSDTGVADASKSTRKEVIQRPAQRESRFYLSLAGAGEFDVHATKFLSNGEGNFGVIGGPSLPVKIQSKDFTNTHDPVISARAEAGYHILPYLSVFAGFTYDHAHGDSAVRFGQVRDPGGAFGPNNAVYDLYANLGNYEAYAGRAGFKLALPRTLLDLIHAPSQISPYLSASAGGKYIEPGRADFYSPGLVQTQRLRLYDASWVFTSDVLFGYELKLSRAASIVFESGYGYDTKPDRAGGGNGGGNGRQNSPAAVGLTGVNRGGDRFYSTVSLGAKVRF